MAEIDKFVDGADKPRPEQMRVLKPRVDDYEIDDRFEESAKNVRTTQELMALLESNPKVDIEARVLCESGGKVGIKRLNRQQFIEGWKRAQGHKWNLREWDNWSSGDSFNSGNEVGKDYIPLLGGPFHKQLYNYDYLKMHGLAFYAYHHDPIAKFIVDTTRDFVLGRGFRIDIDDPKALALWRVFEEAIDFETLVDQITTEIAIYGEVMIWKLPKNETKISYQLQPGQEPPKGVMPRFRLIDPSVIWEIVTYPEDITRVLYYQWVAPTQYQIYTGSDKGRPVPSTKFIFQQIPSDEVLHFKINSVSNEKRGRSDLFPVLGYLKRLRDSVNYSVIGMQKASAWSIDTKVEGSQSDVDNYTAAINAMGEVAPPGSEFVHTAKITREYLSNGATSKGIGGQGSAFDWCLNMIAIGSRYPTSYFGTHQIGGGTRAGALVATEPVAKFLEARQKLISRIIKAIGKKMFADFGMNPNIEVTFPEIAVQDRSAKIKDVVLAETQGYISHERAATITAKELDIDEYEYEEEMTAVASNPSTPLDPVLPEDDEPGPSDAKPSGVSNDQRRQLSMQR